MKVGVAVLLGAALLVGAAALPAHNRFPGEADEIKHLPGLRERLPFRHYSGYLNVDKANGRNLFYWFTESPEDNDNLLLWLKWVLRLWGSGD